MNFLKEISILKPVCNSLFYNPNVIAVRFAKRKLWRSKQTYEYTDMSISRKAKGLTSNPNKFGPLTNLPDYSFLDGRPVPLGSNLKTRLERQQGYADTITRLSYELDFAKERYQEKMNIEQDTRERIIQNKLKRKGAALVNNKK